MAIIPTSGEFTKVPEGGGSDNRLVVTCTPTEPDYSGTMDKTVAEIFAAWNAGKEIYFYIADLATFPVAAITDAGEFFAYGVMVENNDNFIVLMTHSRGSAYITKICQLSPLGS